MDLEFNDIQSEVQGVMNNGKITFKGDSIVFKNARNNKTERISADDIEVMNWMKVAEKQGIRIIVKDGILCRYFGFKESDCDKLTKFIKVNYEKDITPKDFSVRGWNWGAAKFHGGILSFEVNNLTAFDIALSNVSQCTTGKNEVTLEFHQNEDAPVSLLEMRFHIPSSDLAGDVDTTEAFQKRVMQQASVVSVSGDAVAIFREVQCLTPRGRYDFKIFSSFLQLHGKTFDYKIPMSTVVKLFLLPAKDGRQNFLVINLDPPIKRGETRYHFVVFSFMQDEQSNIELPFSEEDIRDKYDNKITKDLAGPTYEVVSKIIRVLINRKITTPSSFKGNFGTSAVSCSYKAAAGYLYPLERGFIYIHKPPVHIRFEEISCVNFARSGGSTRSFDLEVELKSGVIHTFSSIEKEEYGNLYQYVADKKLKVKTKSQLDKPKYVDEANDDGADAPDAYLERVKQEGKERDDDDQDDDDDDDESTDEDFVPTNAGDDEVPEEYDTDAVSSDSESGAGGSSGESKPKKAEIKEKPKSKPKPKKEPSEKKEHKKKVKDDNKPKRPPSAYMLWFNETRDKIKSDNPGISFADIGKKGGELWKNINGTEKEQWEKKAAQAKDKYTEAMKAYVESGATAKASKEADSDGEKTTTNKSKEKGSKPKTSYVSPAKTGTSTNYLSKEFIEDDDDTSSSDDSKSDKVVKQKEKPAKESTAKENNKTISSKKETVQITQKKKRDKRGDENSGGSSSGSSTDSSNKRPKKKLTATSNATAMSKRKKETDSEEEKKLKKKSKKASSDDESSNDESEEDEPSESTPATSEDDD